MAGAEIFLVVPLSKGMQGVAQRLAAVRGLLYAGKSPREVLFDILSREPKQVGGLERDALVLKARSESVVCEH